jgi:hypothetical protein
MIGAAMSVLKKCDTQVHLLVSRKQDRSLFRQALSDQADPFEIASQRYPAEESAFAEDFMTEHSLRGVQINSMEMAGSF